MDGLDQHHLAGFVLVDFLAFLSRITELSKCVPVIQGFQDAYFLLPAFLISLVGEVEIVCPPAKLPFYVPFPDRVSGTGGRMFKA